MGPGFRRECGFSVGYAIAQNTVTSVLFGRRALLRPVGAVGRAARTLHQRVPAPPEGAHLQFILARRLVFSHAAGNVRPGQFAPRRKAALAAFERVNIVRGAEPGGPEKRDEILHPLLPQLLRFTARHVGPGVDLHVIRRARIRSSSSFAVPVIGKARERFSITECPPPSARPMPWMRLAPAQLDGSMPISARYWLK